MLIHFFRYEKLVDILRRKLKSQHVANVEDENWRNVWKTTAANWDQKSRVCWNNDTSIYLYRSCCVMCKMSLKEMGFFPHLMIVYIYHLILLHVSLLLLHCTEKLYTYQQYTLNIPFINVYFMYKYVIMIIHKKLKLLGVDT